MTTLETRLAALEHEVAALRADRDIRTVLSQYAVGVDEKHPHVLWPLFTDDAVIEVPAWSVEVRGIDAVMRFFENYWRRFDNPRRYYANEVVTVTGDTASAFMYWHVTQEEGADSVLGWGTYDWGFRRQGGQWLIAREVVHIRAMTTLARGWAGQGTMSL
ncbi:MAG: nuclear transport factor 2 family protein [Gammaproteobacteria bacterium]|nr:nuclear transport factor 2 family protein [Gammaproteobacteria bacterium]MCP5200076.1 nuclear transport factor 2 family protein [Gammaproteobacteria bacterium]